MVRRLYEYLGILTICAAFFICVPHATAQFATGGQGFSLTANPSLPEPYAQVVVAIDDYSVNAVGAEVSWSVNGEVLKDSQNERSITLTAGGLGEKQTVTVNLLAPGGTQMRATTVIAPTVLDLVLEADTYVPSFYKGRALPGRTSMLHATAVVHDSEGLSDSAYTYRWTLGQEVLFGGAVKGKNTISFAMPIYSKALTVEVIGPEGRVVARKSITPTSVQPELYFYEWSPLKGLYQKAISDSFPLIGEESTIYGEPFFVNDSPNNENAVIDWNIGDVAVPADAGEPRALTLYRDAFGIGDVDLRIVTKDLVPQVLEGGFNVITY